ncbi:MAG: hypothetical protein E6J91_19040 [Deltaproteobacteria bacterium]|nr:MAG: hypothetical protein E6J91_19040 [Deltaproteobacteria bacterium]
MAAPSAIGEAPGGSCATITTFHGPAPAGGNAISRGMPRSVRPWRYAPNAVTSAATVTGDASSSSTVNGLPVSG